MTGRELYAKLKEQGTGEARLKLARRFLKHQPEASAADLVAALEKCQPPVGPIGTVTLNKARQLAGLAPATAESEEWLSEPDEDGDEVPVPPPMPEQSRPKMPRKIGPQPVNE